MRFDEKSQIFFEEIFRPHFTTEEREVIFSMEFIFLYEISAALVYMGEMSTPTTHWRCGRHLNREAEKFLFTLDHQDEFSVWPKMRALSLPLPISENAAEIEPLGAKFFFCFDLVATGEQTLLLKKERKVSDTAEDVFSYTKQKAAFPQKISARKLLKALKNSHFRDII